MQLIASHFPTEIKIMSDTTKADDSRKSWRDRPRTHKVCPKRTMAKEDILFVFLLKIKADILLCVKSLPLLV